MTANIFGSSFKMVGNDKKYIDSKFATLSTNLALKLDKTGDKMQGELDMDGNRITNVKLPVDRLDAVNKEYVDLDVVTLNENLQLKVDKNGGTMLGDLHMGGNKISNIGEPVYDFDVASKKYVDEKIVNLYTLSTTGLIPHHINVIDATGFVVTTSSNHGNNHTGYKVFNPANKTSWRVTSDMLKTTNFWIAIECPFAVRVYRFLIQPAENTKLVKWSIRGRMDSFHLWEDLPFTLEAIEGNTTRVFTLANPKLAKEYWCYSILIEEAEGTNPGLTYWQLYTVNPVFS